MTEDKKYMFKKVEGELYGYYRDLKKKKMVEDEINFLNRMLGAIDHKIKTCNITIDADIKGVEIKESVQTSPDGSSAVEKAIERGITQLEKEQGKRIERLNKAEAELRNIEYKIHKMQSIINMFNKDIQQFIEYKYKLEYSNQELADKFHYSLKTIITKRDKIVEEIIKFRMI